ncbi:efflux RND transporter permease subunit [Ferrimonas balearica]|uniref:efflux RND transporter permease subunit n=1 Tax=Ferrimonas balearica TaxID=44012 RepID=UPI001C996E89|nr:efflux RND transporter permease subunit [Ferrimonas balearica]MBY5920553.1 efflux RND transporter permease subunit [Ferrimonas balearica]MBY5996762.1 efflux RND transporter permease subunit [Ferrimonas balearica]
MNIAQSAIAKRTTTWVLVLLVLLGGWISYEKLGRFEDPEFVIRQAVVITQYPGATAQEVDNEVTDVIVGALMGMQEVHEITSTSKPGVSEVIIEMDRRFTAGEAEIQQVWDKLRRKVDNAAMSLPPGASHPYVNDDFGDVYAMYYAVTGEGYSFKQLQDYVDMLARELSLVPGVANVATQAEQQERIFVEVDSARVHAFGLTMDQVYDVLAKQNAVTLAGTMQTGSMNVNVIPISSVSSFQEIENIQIALGDTLVRLGDIAEVTRGYQDQTELVRFNGQPAIGLGVSNVSGGNVVVMGDAVQARLAELDDRRPLGMEINPISLQSVSVAEAVDNFVLNLIAAVVIVFTVLFFFLGLRSSIIIGGVLVLTVAGTLIVMLIDDIAMQRISLGALIIALGMLVDNAIVVTDGVLTRLQQNPKANRKLVIGEVVRATQWPLLGGTIVGILAFSAIGLSPSNMGEYAGSLFWVILYSMMLSWVLAITVVPLLCHDFLKVNDSKGQKPSRILKAYRTFLVWVLHNRKKSLATILTVMVLGVLSLQFVPPGFMPESERPQFVVDINLPQGSDFQRTADVVAQIEQDVMAKEGVTNVTSFIGAGGLRFMLIYSPEPANTAYAQLLVDVDDFKHIAPLLEQLNEELSAKYADAAIMAWKFMLGPGGGKKIEAAFSGPDAAVLRQLSEEAKAIMASNPALMAIQDDWRNQVPTLRPEYDSQVAQRLGLTAQEINGAIAQTLNGRDVGVYREGNSLIPIVARAPEAERTHQRAVENTEVFSPAQGAYVQVSQLVTAMDVTFEDGLLKRIDRVPTIKAQADPAPGVLSFEAFEEIRAQLEAEMTLPSGYSLEWHGEYKDAKEGNEGLAISAPYGFAAMILAVVFMFNGIRQALVIWLTVPLALVGVSAGLIVFQTPFEFMATLGTLSLVGMMVKNAIVLVDQADQDVKAGITPYEAIIGAALSRARPVVLGATTTILGVAPLIGDAFFKSMSAVIMVGLLVATVLTLVVIPLYYSMIFRVKNPA